MTFSNALVRDLRMCSRPVACQAAGLINAPKSGILVTGPS